MESRESGRAHFGPGLSGSSPPLDSRSRCEEWAGDSPVFGRKVASEPRESLSRGRMAYGPVSLPSAVSHRWFLVVVFAAIGVVIATSFVLYSAQPPRPPPTDNLVFSSAAFVDGNASVIVQNVSRGPYLFSSFQISPIVNDFARWPGGLESKHGVARMP